MRRLRARLASPGPDDATGGSEHGKQARERSTEMGASLGPRRARHASPGMTRYLVMGLVLHRTVQAGATTATGQAARPASADAVLPRKILPAAPGRREPTTTSAAWVATARVW